MKVSYLSISLFLQSQVVTASNCGASFFDACDNVQPCEDPLEPASPTCFESCIDDNDCAEDEACRTLGVCGDRARGATTCTFGCDACMDDGEDSVEFVCLCYETCPLINGEFPSCSTTRRSQCIGREFTHPDIPDDPNPAACLSAYSQVTVLDKGLTNLKDVEQGDKVLVSSATDSSPLVYEYQEIYGFGHRDAYSVAAFLQIKTSSMEQESRPLEITGEHLVMKRNAPSSDGVPVRADSIKVGDVLIGSGGVGEKVVQISSVMRPGLYAPLTKDGYMMVNGVQVSSYTAVQQKDPGSFMVGSLELASHHFMSHAAMAPFRIVCGSSRGVAAPLCDQRNSAGQLLIANEGERLSSWIIDQAIELQMIILSLLLPCIMNFYHMEQFFGGFGMMYYFLPILCAIFSGFVCRSMMQKKLAAKTIN